MAGYLKSFQWDVFISYGWAGSARPDEGDRRWVSQFYDLLNERLRTPLGEGVRMFLDRNADKGGYINDWLAAALDSSALFLFVVSPGSCRANSWCHQEAARFFDRAQPLVSSGGMILAPEDRLLKVVMSPVAAACQPLPMQQVSGRALFEQVAGSPGPIAEPVDWQKPAAVEPVMAQLVDELSRTLQQARTIEQHRVAASGKRVFLGEGTSDLNRERLRRMRRELLLEGHEVRSASPVPEEPEANFLLRTEDAMTGANVAVFAVGEACAAHAGWPASGIALQMEDAFRKSSGDAGFSVYAWEDPNAAVRDPACLARIRPNLRDQHIAGDRAFEYLESNVRQRLRESPPRKDASDAAAAAGSKVVCIEYREEDAPRAAQLRDALRSRQVEVQLAIPTPVKGSLINRIIKKNQTRYYPNSDGLIVFFGDGDYEWVSDVCFAMKEYVRPGKGIIVLAPPKEHPPGKEGFDQPGFVSMRCFDALMDPAFEAWVQQLQGSHA